MPGHRSARLQQFKRANPTPRPRAVATRAPAPAPADGPPERAPPEGEAEAAADAEAAAVIPQAKGILSNGSASRASASLRRRPAAAAAASAQPAGPTTVELVKDAGGFGVEYTVAADGTLVVVSCAGGDAAPAPGAEILAVGGVDVKADADALRKALDSVRSTVMDGEMVAWVFAPRTDAAAGGSEDVRLAESMAAHLARPRAAAQADSGVKPPAGGAEATVFRGRTELRREWKHNAVWDIESGLWASPFFGAFTAIRFFSLVLLAQLVRPRPGGRARTCSVNAFRVCLRSCWSSAASSQKMASLSLAGLCSVWLWRPCPRGSPGKPPR